MTMMDNLYGFGMRLGAGDKDNSALIDINNNIIYGELPIPDCPDSNNGDYCWKKNKEALMPGAFNKAKGNHAKSDELPYMKITGNSWSGRTHFSNNLIKNFDKTKMGKKKWQYQGAVLMTLTTLKLIISLTTSSRISVKSHLLGYLPQIPHGQDQIQVVEIIHAQRHTRC